MITQPHVLALSSGRRTVPHGGGRPTAIDKQPVDAFEVRDPGPKHGGLGSGVVGDEIGNPKHHGGELQAVYAYPREDLDFWEQQVGRPLRSGGFGENVTTVGIDTTHALVGELWRIGDVVLRVEVPRIPCSTFAKHMDEPRWVRRFTEEGRTGAYLSVVTPGVVRTDTPVEVERPTHDIDLLLLFRAFTGDLEAARRVVDADVVQPEVQEGLVDTLGRRGR
ncbi:molybdenum cofactor biosysynthesis protein [Terrabacter tumescens]|uniref:Molybdenum cofactor biosysynthesis protein n=1 Tax=Terrabacter tumescens TaxID=60443 RepID=A0ABQ2HTV4_9MICO|nr:MOSC domain-containing protein [Terrabacter tumescens]GGM90657.1 molybdenum cofactor biosysynthesis protein [Terrabacter tumescens]